jgi:hypothetical protein
VIELDPCADSRWSEFVASHPDALVYHHAAWLAALGEGYGHRPGGLAYARDGKLLGVLPLARTRGAISGRRLVSLPYTPVAGPLASDRTITGELLRAAVDLTREGSGQRLEIKSSDPSLPDVDDDLTRLTWTDTYVRELPPAGENLRFGNSRNHGRIKWAVNKANRLGVHVREAERESDVRDWYALYLKTMRTHAVPPRPYRFFAALWDLLAPRGLMSLLLAERVEGVRRRLIAGSILLRHGATVFYAFNGRRDEDLSLRPNDLIQWHAMHAATQAGFRFYDFGEVEADQHGLGDFKSKWGARPRSLYRYFAPPPGEGKVGPVASGGFLHRTGAAVWRRLPLRVTAAVGAQLYRHV